MVASQHHLTLINLMAVVVAAALGMGLLMWDPPPRAYPPWSSSSGSLSRLWLSCGTGGAGAGAYSAGPWAGGC